MCGITGFLSLDGDSASPVVLGRMMGAIAHRGPDGEGQFVDGAFAIGHRRLAIIDLSPAGRQPMTTRDGRYVLSYNGELYNFAELKCELEALGCQFRSRTDSEVVLHALAQWGVAALDRFNGMFAIAFWDRRSGELLLARDRYGVKPLYYASRGGVFAFGSEMKAILQHPAFTAKVDVEALVEYLTFQNFFTDRTLLEGIRLLPPGCHLKVSEQRPDPRTVRYWDYDFSEPERPCQRQAYVEELDRLFRQAVRRQLMSDVPVGSYLSGGTDSASITAIASAELPHLSTFTCGFDLHFASDLELTYDEREKAEAISYHFKTEHYEVVLKSGDMERSLRPVVWHLEEPRVGQSYPNYYVSRLAGKFVKVVLSGTGGDELFGGYPWRYHRAATEGGFESYVDSYYQYWQRLVDNGNVARVFAPIWNTARNVDTREIFRSVFNGHAPSQTRNVDYVNHSLYFESKTFLHGLLVVEDKLSMAHGLETRVPFLDNDLVDFAMKVPVGMKLAGVSASSIDENESRNKAALYYQRTRDGKLIVREMMERYMPPQVAQLEKQGFSAPDATWFRRDSADYVCRRLLGPRARIYEYIDRDAVSALIHDHLDGRRNRRLLIWSLLYVEQFLETYCA